MKKYFEKKHVPGIFAFVCLIVAFFGILYLPSLNRREFEVELQEKFSWLSGCESDISQMSKWKAYEFPKEDLRYGLGAEYYAMLPEGNNLIICLRYWWQEEEKVENLEMIFFFKGNTYNSRLMLIKNGKLIGGREARFVLEWFKERGIFYKPGLSSRIQYILNSQQLEES